ncbi:GNAT family N-acetyltransferase [Enterococcus gallinarum]|uniref:GNAT family N-acetyltransferase n=1 Tax=Enterococcus gallinarum TaxID=1353 RepID=UPI0028923E52|nr:GNAT family N-acetyltransferase [Enterococcus gallinarum]MDT2681505.1 GNAT family N-acetyltransferase [Enterococcus gallinarum]
MTETCLTLRPLTNEIELVDRWLRKEYIKKWLGSAEDWLTEIRNETGEFDYIHHFIVLLDDKPIGFCQYYVCEKTVKGIHGNMSRLEHLALIISLGKRRISKKDLEIC